MKKYQFKKKERTKILDFQAGRVHLTENTKDAIIREIEEELGIKVDKDNLKLVQIAENFFDYLDNGKVKNVHELSYIYNIVLDDSYDITKEESFTELEKPHVTFVWKTKEEVLKEYFKLVPNIVKNVIGKKELHYDIIDDRKYS